MNDLDFSPRAVLFDLDDTLAESFQPPLPSTIERLRLLLEKIPVAIITAAGFPRIERDFLTHLADSPHIDRFTVFANSSAECFVWQGGWTLLYDFELTDAERARISAIITESVKATGIQAGQTKYEPKIIDRRVQIAYAAIGLTASEADKNSWDPDQSKRRLLKSEIEKRLPGFEVLIGGKTTIDITRTGVDKSYGVRYFAERQKCEPEDMLYVGDALYEGGNDAVVIATGVRTRQVSSPLETERVIDAVLERLAA